MKVNGLFRQAPRPKGVIGSREAICRVVRVGFYRRSAIQNDNSLKVRFSATLGHKPEIELGLA
jgi:hypothetical protein